MSKADEVLALLTTTLQNQGVLVETETNATISFRGSGNGKRASLIRPFYSEADEADVDIHSEAKRLVDEVKAQIRAYVEPVEVV